MGEELRRYVRLVLEVEVEVVDPTALRAAVLKGSPGEEIWAAVEQAVAESPLRDRNEHDAATAATQALWESRAWPIFAQRLRAAGLSTVAYSSFIPRIRKDDDPDTLRALPEMPARRNDGTVPRVVEQSVAERSAATEEEGLS
jgi:hypothetical protein